MTLSCFVYLRLDAARAQTGPGSEENQGRVLVEGQHSVAACRGGGEGGLSVENITVVNEESLSTRLALAGVILDPALNFSTPPPPPPLPSPKSTEVFRSVSTSASWKCADLSALAVNTPPLWASRACLVWVVSVGAARRPRLFLTAKRLSRGFERLGYSEVLRWLATRPAQGTTVLWDVWRTRALNVD